MVGFVLFFGYGLRSYRVVDVDCCGYFVFGLGLYVVGHVHVWAFGWVFEVFAGAF